MIDEHDVNMRTIDQQLDFIELTCANQIFGINSSDGGSEFARNLSTGCQRQRMELFIIIAVRG